MLMTAIPLVSKSGAGISYSFRFQLAITFLFSLMLPVGALIAFMGLPAIFNAAAYNSLIAAGVAIIILLLTLRRLEFYPGVNITRHILPALAIIYGCILTIFAIFRAPYSNSILISCFLLTISARYVVAAINHRSPRREYLIVPGGRSQSVRLLSQLPTHLLLSPVLSQRQNVALIVDLHHDHGVDWERFIAEVAISGIPVYHYKQVLEATTGEVQIEHLSENSFGALIPSLAYRKMKRIVDIILSIVALPLLAPIFLIVCILIKLDSKGPALFRQQRMGYQGRPFEVFKFRTMTVTNSGENAETCVTRPNDQRITRAGRFLRRTRIDELPQVFNVIKGDMSWIGPRPEAISLSHLYETKLPFYRYRHIVRPGITGWAQVNQGHVTSIGDIDFKLRYDFYYIKNFSYWIDLLIIFRTINILITGKGAR